MSDLARRRSRRVGGFPVDGGLEGVVELDVVVDLRFAAEMRAGEDFVLRRSFLVIMLAFISSSRRCPLARRGVIFESEEHGRICSNGNPLMKVSKVISSPFDSH